MATKKKITKSILTVGSKVFIRTVTHYYTGILTAIDKDWLHIDKAAWIADASRWSTALDKGVLNEVEPYPDGEVLVARGAIVDVCAWPHDLPRAVK